MKRNQLLRQIQEYDFALNELTLYLDTHPTDVKAMQLHASLSKDLGLLKATYESQFAPLTAANGVQNNRWNWLDAPWPWENNCEVK